MKGSGSAAGVSGRLSALIEEGRARARSTGMRVLVSCVERTAEVDPLDVLERLAVTPGEFASEADDRMYWTRPADDFAIGGFGAVAVLTARGSDRFAEVDEEWRELVGSAVIDNAGDESPGLGPVLLGGFAFDPQGPASEHWADFPAARLFVPRVQLTVVGDACWLTLNMLVLESGECDTSLDALLSLRAAALDGTDVGSVPADIDSAPAAVHTFEVQPASAWEASVSEAVEAIRGGELEKVVLAREVRVVAPRDFDIPSALRRLRSAHRLSYVFGCWHGDAAFIGASPERLVRLDGREVRASSLAGSAARGATREEDEQLASGLLNNPKDRLEHEVVRRSLCRNLADLCDEVVAGDEPTLLSLPQVHHLHTDVRARLRRGGSLLALVGRLHPTPAVGGEPPAPALRFIREHEGMDRGWYAAPIGWVQRDRGEFAVALRSALVRGNEAVLFAGCGIMADSNPSDEYAESLLKLRPMQMALASSVTAALATPVASAAANR